MSPGTQPARTTLRRLGTTELAGGQAGRVLGLLGALAVAASAAIHLHLWAGGYRSIPTIGTLFLLQGLAGVALAVALAAAGRRVVVTAAGLGYLLSSVAGLLLSVRVGLFGFRDSLAAPWAKPALFIEVAGAVLLGLRFLLGRSKPALSG